MFPGEVGKIGLGGVTVLDIYLCVPGSYYCIYNPNLGNN